MDGKVVIFSAPSGAGKTTIVKEMLNQQFGLEFSVSACSRPKRENEVDGKDYYFMTTEAFKQKIENDEFLEWEEVYKDQFYGTLKSEVDRIWAKGKDVIFDVDVVGGVNVKSIFGDKALAIFIMPPSLEVLKERLLARSTENEESLKKRLDKAELEMTYADDFDVQIINDDLEVAIDEAKATLFSFLSVE
ncbi:MAG: guanylate kinase [Desulfobacterales bacterium]|nr:guanylate kinase [Desulfobacterales bacterium]